MAKPPDDMTTLWVRDENGDMRLRVKQGARMKGQKSADFVRDALEMALEAAETSFAAKSDRKICQSDRCTHVQNH